MAETSNGSSTGSNKEESYVCHPCFSSFIVSKGKEGGDISKAKKVFEAIPDPNVWHHTALIAAYATNGDWLKAVQHLQELKRLAANNPKLRPNTITYSTVIEACARSRYMGMACQLWGEMVAAGIEPDSVTYAILLTHFSRGCDWDQVDALLQEMHAKGMAARTAIYTAFIRKLCRTNQWNKALGLYLVMRELGADITPAMYTDLLQVLSAAGKPLMVSQLLQEAREDGTPNTNDLLDTSLAALLSAGFHTEAKTLHDRMVDSGWEPSTAYQQTQHQDSSSSSWYDDSLSDGGSASSASGSVLAMCAESPATSALTAGLPEWGQPPAPASSSSSSASIEGCSSFEDAAEPDAAVSMRPAALTQGSQRGLEVPAPTATELPGTECFTEPECPQPRTLPAHGHGQQVPAAAQAATYSLRQFGPSQAGGWGCSGVVHPMYVCSYGGYNYYYCGVPYFQYGGGVSAPYY